MSSPRTAGYRPAAKGGEADLHLKLGGGEVHFDCFGFAEGFQAFADIIVEHVAGTVSEAITVFLPR